MLITNTLLVGGALYASVQQWRKTRSTEVIIPSKEAVLQAETDNAQHYTTMSTLALGMTLAGSIAAFPPLVLSSIPVHVYANLPLFEEAIATLTGKEEKRSSIIYALVLSGTLASNHMLTANLLQWGIQRSRLLGARMQQKGYELSQMLGEGVQNWFDQVAGKKPPTAWIVRDEFETEIPFADLRVGDQVLFREGEFVSVTGKVTRGEADVFDWSLTRNMGRHPTAQPLPFTMGDTVKPRMLLLRGALYVRIESVT